MNAIAKRKSTNSRVNPTDKVLVTFPAERIPTFLVECANLPNPIDYPEHRPHFERWLKRWGRMFSYQAETEGGEWQAVQVPREHLEMFAPIVRTTLCRLWGEHEPRQQDWYCYCLRDAHRQMVRHLEKWDERPIWGTPETAQSLTDYALQDVPRVGPFESAMSWLQRNYSLMLHCADPLCSAPYFFRAKSQKRQRYCSPECADTKRREAKLKWWNESPNSPKNRNKPR